MPYQPNAIARLGRQTANVQFDASTGWGTSPATLTLVAPPEAFDRVTRQVNDLTISQGENEMTFHDCLTVGIEEAEPNDAGLVKIILHDARWRWQFGTIDGDYNVVKDDGTLLREKSPRDLAQLLSGAMGQGLMDVRGLPNSGRPRKAWRSASPAAELDQLCNEYGCVVVFNGHKNKASICKVGVGAPIPQQPVVSESRGLSIPAWPSRVVIDTAAVLFQAPLLFFEAVGMDTDGKIKPIDQLAYKPAAGWAQTDPAFFIGIDTVYQSEGGTAYARDLAINTVYKWYRLTGLAAPGRWSPSALLLEPNRPRSKDDIGPFLGTRLERDEATNTRLPIVAVCEHYNDRENFANQPPGSKVKFGATINESTKCIEFAEPLFKFDEATEAYSPAEPVVYAAFAVSSEGIPVRYKLTKQLGRNFGAGARVEVHDEIVREIIEAAPFNGPGKDNKAEVDKECQAFLDAIVQTFREFDTANPTLGYLVTDLECDGILRAIQWSASSTSPVQTQLAYNGELNEFMPDLRDTPAMRAKRVAEAAARQRAAIVNGQLKPAPEI